MDYLFGLQIYQEERLGLWFHVQTAYPVQTSTSTPEGILHECKCERTKKHTYMKSWNWYIFGLQNILSLDLTITRIGVG